MSLGTETKRSAEAKRGGAVTVDAGTGVLLVEATYASQISGRQVDVKTKKSRRQAFYDGREYIPITGKWVYVLKQPGNFGGGKKQVSLLSEIYAQDENTWLILKNPGKGESSDKSVKSPGSVFHPPKDLLADHVFHFFLSGFQLTPGAVKQLETWAGEESATRKDPVRVQPHLRDEFYTMQLGIGAPDPEYTTMPAIFDKEIPGRRHRIALPDPFGLVEAAYALSYLPALEIVNQFNGNERLLAEGVVAGAIEVAAAKNPKILDKLPHVGLLGSRDTLDQWWWYEEKAGGGGFRRGNAPKFGSSGGEFSGVSSSHSVLFDQEYWKYIPGRCKNSLEAWKEAFNAIREEVYAHCGEQVLSLWKWMDGPAHRIVEMSCSGSAGIPEASLLHHLRFVTERLDETPQGQMALAQLASDKTRYVRRFFTSFSKDVEKFKDSYSRSLAASKERTEQKVEPKDFTKDLWSDTLKLVDQEHVAEPTSIVASCASTVFGLYKNFYSAITVIETQEVREGLGKEMAIGEKLSKALVSSGYYSKWGFAWEEVKEEKVKLSMFWWDMEATVKKEMTKPIIKVPPNRVIPNFIAREKAFVDAKLKKYKGVVSAYKGLESAFSTSLALINIGIAMNRVMSAGDPDKWEKAKVGLEVAKFMVESAEKLAVLEAGGEDALAKTTKVAFARMGGAIGFVGAVIEFRETWNKACESWFEDDNNVEGAARAFQAVAAGVSAYVGLYTFVFAAAGSGPVGWIVLGAFAVGSIVAGWIADAVHMDNWDYLARYSFLGENLVAPDGKRISKGVLQNYHPEDFGRDLSAQVHSARALQASTAFRAFGVPARYGYIDVTPGSIGNDAKIHFAWYVEYGTSTISDAYDAILIRAVMDAGNIRGKIVEAKATWSLGKDEAHVGEMLNITGEEYKGGRCISFTVRPGFLERMRGIHDSERIQKMIFMAQIDVLGDGILKIPFDKEAEFEQFEIGGKSSEVTWHNWVKLDLGRPNLSTDKKEFV